MRAAKGELATGVKEGTGKDATSPLKYLQYDGLPTNMSSSDEGTSWCGAFVNYCLESQGYTGQQDNPLAVENWNGFWGRNWEAGVQLSQPTYGAVVTLGNEHMGFIVGLNATGTRALILGGNQGDAVNISSWPIRKDFKYFVPRNYIVPPLDSNSEYLRGTHQGTVPSGGRIR